MGSLCEQCDDGYYGDPEGLLGFPTRCQKCNCSGNIDVNAVGNCDPLTGDCIKCIYNTRNGPLERCELCAVGFYGNATDYPKPQCTGMLILVRFFPFGKFLLNCNLLSVFSQSTKSYSLIF